MPIEYIIGTNFMKLLGASVLALCLATGFTQAQSLSPDEINKMIEERVSNLNPYQALLNHPDPERSRMAMQIMLESKDADLTAMALEFGLLSANPEVKRLAFETWLSSRPILSIRFDGSEVTDRDFVSMIRGSWSGTADEKIGYWRIPVGNYLEESRCYASTDRQNECFITVNADGVFLTPSRLNARATISDDGQLVGSGSLSNVSEAVPFTVQLLD